jgi:D-glycero-D-manno-heptose 1,7-bisphosphate phosphatase
MRRDTGKSLGVRGGNSKPLPSPQPSFPNVLDRSARLAGSPTFRAFMNLLTLGEPGFGEGGRSSRGPALSSHNSPLLHAGKRPAVFLDRDGTINEEMGYINHLSRFRLLPEAAPAIARLNKAGLPVVVITNQSGAARGYFPASLVDEVHRHMHTLLSQAGGRVDAVYACLHAPEAGCSCRKPQPGLLLQAAQDLGLDLSRSYLVGDRYVDIQTAVNAGVQGILVLTGYGLGEYEHFHAHTQSKPVHVALNLLDAVDFIVAQFKTSMQRSE